MKRILFFVLTFLGSLLVGSSIVLQAATLRQIRQRQQQQYLEEVAKCVEWRCGPAFSIEPPTDELLAERVAYAQECIRLIESKKRFDAVP